LCCKAILYLAVLLYRVSRKFAMISPLKTKRTLLYLKTQSYRAVNIFQLGYKNRSVYDESGTSRCLFSDKYKTYKYSVGRAYDS